MSYTHMRANGGFVNVGVTLGALQKIVPHTGLDHVSYHQLRFEHGVIDMSAGALRSLVIQGQESLVAQRRPGPECSGAVADLGGE